ncbi:hypothetical protein ACFO5O_11425 [Geojedonia litorea]|uniref:Outer membrane protein beta-barrel domain-containing protein n=1 Tax=Geojedonia litorea TaxID=1268269 RepID=A0ABV9N626_9FLAO
MNDKKHIDRLFQEKLKDFDVHPSDKVWANIEKELHKDKRKRRVIPLWWKVAGVAALLVLFFSIGGLVFNTSNENSLPTNPLVDTENQITEPESSSEQPINPSIKDNNNSIAADNLDNNGQESNASTKNSTLNANQKNNLTIASKSSENNNSSIENKSLGDDTKTNTAIVDNTNSNADKNTSNLPETNQGVIEKTNAKELIKNSTKNTETSIADNSTKNDKNELVEDLKTGETSIEDALIALNDLNEKEKVNNEKINRWNISPNVAPVYFNSIGQGSPIDEQLVDNSKSGEINMSYGINGSYAITEKLKVRAGVNQVKLGYNTNDVVVYNGVNSLTGNFQPRNSTHINFRDKSQNTTILGSPSLNSAAVPEIIASSKNASLNQELGFIEIPIELEYAIIDKRIGFNVIGGFSTLFLNKNDVYSTSDGNKTLLGEANNLNNTSYSANFGLGLNYNISDKVKLNLEPTFKYQINTFRDASGNFQPYFIGVYTGLSYKF